MAKEGKFDERRVETRVRTEGMLSVTVTVGELTAECHLVDISTRGAYIATGATFDRGSYVTLVFELGPKGAQEIKAQVARSKPHFFSWRMTTSRIGYSPMGMSDLGKTTV